MQRELEALHRSHYKDQVFVQEHKFSQMTGADDVQSWNSGFEDMGSLGLEETDSHGVHPCQPHTRLFFDPLCVSRLVPSAIITIRDTSTIVLIRYV